MACPSCQSVPFVLWNVLVLSIQRTNDCWTVGILKCYIYKSEFQDVNSIPKPNSRDLNNYFYFKTDIRKGKVLSSIPLMVNLKPDGALSILY